MPIDWHRELEDVISRDNRDCQQVSYRDTADSRLKAPAESDLEWLAGPPPYGEGTDGQHTLRIYGTRSDSQ